jgi:hypothetical protein
LLGKVPNKTWCGQSQPVLYFSSVTEIVSVVSVVFGKFEINKCTTPRNKQTNAPKVSNWHISKWVPNVKSTT